MCRRFLLLIVVETAKNTMQKYVIEIAITNKILPLSLPVGSTHNEIKKIPQTVVNMLKFTCTILNYNILYHVPVYCAISLQIPFIL